MKNMKGIILQKNIKPAVVYWYVGWTMSNCTLAMCRYTSNNKQIKGAF